MPNRASTSIASRLNDEAIERALSAAECESAEPALARALAYARARYGIGVARYSDAVEKLGFRGMRRVLDVGCGVGQWSLALATQNETVVGIDPRREYVDVATSFADATELSPHVEFRTGNAESLDEPRGSTDAILCHMALMWVPERELALENFARCLEDQGRLYLSYTTPHMLVRSVAMTERVGDWERARIPASTLLSSSLYALGAFSSFGSRVRAYEPGELERLAELHGLTVEESPHVEDGPHEWLGRRLSGDFVARKAADADAFERDFVLDDDGDFANRIEALIDLGAPRLALRLLDRTTTRQRQPQLTELRAKALLKVGDLPRAAAVLDELPVDKAPRLRGLYQLQSGDPAAAIAQFNREDPHRDREFLLACAHLLAREYEPASSRFRAELREVPGSARAFAGAVLAALDAGEERIVSELVRGLTSESGGLTSPPPAAPEQDVTADGPDEVPETSEAAKLEAFGLAAEGRMPYQVTNRALVPLVFDSLGEISPEDVFVDFGCGKGRMVLAAAMRPFRRVVGVDISPELCAVARENVEQNRVRLRCPEVEVIAADATQLDVPDDMTVAYLYNPFQGAVFRQALERIIASLDRRPRRIRLVYLLPAMHEAVLETGRFHVVKTAPFGEGPAQRVIVYETAAGLPPRKESPRAPAADVPVYSLEVTAAEFGEAEPQTRATFIHVVTGLEENDFFGTFAPPAKEWALIDLDEYTDIEAFRKAARKIHTGNAVRGARKATERGYHSKFFDPRTFVGDLVEIDQSAPERQGSAMAGHYGMSVEERGGYPSSFFPPEEPSENLAWDRYFGVFRPDPGHTQGDVVVDERLLSYVKLRRVGPFLFYGTILGHSDHLREGVMYRMHLDLVDYVLRNRRLLVGGDETADRSLAGARLLGYARYFGLGEGLLMWKKRMLFGPGYVLMRYPGEH